MYNKENYTPLPFPIYTIDDIFILESIRFRKKSDYKIGTNKTEKKKSFSTN